MTPHTWYIVREGLGVRLGLGLGPGGELNERWAFIFTVKIGLRPFFLPHTYVTTVDFLTLEPPLVSAVPPAPELQCSIAISWRARGECVT